MGFLCAYAKFVLIAELFVADISIAPPQNATAAASVVTVIEDTGAVISA
jgi:hypothetical protein